MSKSTVVSILPYALNEYKPGLIPPRYLVPAAKEGDFEVVIVEDARNDVYILDGRSISRIISSEEVAGSIAKDHIEASIETSETAFPGIKSISGEHSKEEIKTKFPELLEALNSAQRAWFSRLVQRADDIWNDPNGRGKNSAISDLMRHAARCLGLNKEWVTNARVDMVPCPACTSFIPQAAIVCPNCKITLKPAEYEKLSKAMV